MEAIGVNHLWGIQPESFAVAVHATALRTRGQSAWLDASVKENTLRHRFPRNAR